MSPFVGSPGEVSVRFVPTSTAPAGGLKVRSLLSAVCSNDLPRSQNPMTAPDRDRYRIPDWKPITRKRGPYFTLVSHNPKTTRVASSEGLKAKPQFSSKHGANDQDCFECIRYTRNQGYERASPKPSRITEVSHLSGANMAEIIRFIPRSKRERARLIRAARAIYDSIFSPTDPVGEKRKQATCKSYSWLRRYRS